jgi:Family of unknown function (DUF6352)
MTQPTFWPSSALAHFTVNADQQLLFSPDYFRALLTRVELAPIPESCANECALHDRLLADPLQALSEAQIKAITDPDAQDNYRIFTRYRAHCLAAPTVAAAYLNLFKGDGVSVPPLFVHELTQALLHHILQTEPKALEVRMAEFLFRAQKVTVLDDKSVMAADHETVETHAETAGFGSLGEMLRKQNVNLRSLDLDVLTDDNGEAFWGRDERHDFAVSLNRGQPALKAFCSVLEKWLGYFLGSKVTIQHRAEIADERWLWHVGLDAQASSILNDLYNNEEVSPDRLERLLCLFELRFEEPELLRPALRGKPIYLALAMDEHNLVKVKPQNLLLNLPLQKA